jgi:ribosomal protein L44E
MKKILIALALVLALIAGYQLLTAHDQQEVAQQKDTRELNIMAGQKQFMDQTKGLGKQMQKDVDNRMKSTDGKDE